MMKGNFDRFGQFDEYAAQVAKRLAAVDRHRLKGGDVQFEAILHSAIVEAMFHGAQASGAIFDQVAAERAVHETMLSLPPTTHKSRAIAECVSSGLKAGFGGDAC